MSIYSGNIKVEKRTHRLADRCI